MIKYQTEQLADMLEELKPLVVAHHEEVDLAPLDLELEPNYELYEALDEDGLLLITTARDQGVLVGYVIAFKVPSPHYMSHLYAQNDLIYVKDDYRHTDVAGELVDFAEELAKQASCSVMTYNMKAFKPFESLLQSRGYFLSEIVYSKYIKED